MPKIFISKSAETEAVQTGFLGITKVQRSTYTCLHLYGILVKRSDQISYLTRHQSMTHALNTFVLLITIPTRKITDFKLVLFSCRLFLHVTVTADLVRFYIILNLRKFERLWMLNSLKQNCKSGQNHEFIPFPNRLFLPSLFILTQILSTVSLIKGCAKT